MTSYYSKIGNNQYVRMPFNYGTSFCSFADGKRFKRFYKLLRECSDFPNEVEGQPICHLFSKVFFCKMNDRVEQLKCQRQFTGQLYSHQFPDGSNKSSLPNWTLQV